MIESFRLLLEKAARLHERHEAGRREPFNVFSVLRSEHDEVNLHSRFLAALLDHRQSPGQSRENLADFLHRLGIGDFDHDGASVKREWNNIDILICDRSSLKAVIIENKIRAVDQPRQLARYAGQMKEYECRVLYLTLDGREASEDSADDIEYRCISYKNDLIPWLKDCQRRAYDEPPLRESVAQYLRLIEKLTGTDLSEAYMMDLKKLCLRDRNIVLVHDLGKAMVEAKISLLRKLWREIECRLGEKIPDLPDKSEESDITKARIRRFVTVQNDKDKYHGLYFQLDQHARLDVAVANSIYFGVYCTHDKTRKRYANLRDSFSGWKSDDEFPLYRYPSIDLNLKRTGREQLELLSRKRDRQSYVAGVVSGVSELWKEIKERGLLQAD